MLLKKKKLIVQKKLSKKIHVRDWHLRRKSRISKVLRRISKKKKIDFKIQKSKRDLKNGRKFSKTDGFE